MKTRTLITVLALALSDVVSGKAEIIYATTTFDEILTFDSASPGTILQAHPIFGLQGGESILGIDVRPSTGLVYGLGSGSRLYTINPNTGAATQVGSGLFAPPFLTGTSFGFDFNPVVDLIRVVSEQDQNLRINTGGVVVGVDTALSYAGGTPNPFVTGVAYNNNVAGAGSTTLFAIDSLANTLNSIATPNSGVITTVVGSLLIDVSRLNGFDISGLSGIAYVATPAASSDPGANLYTLNLATGAATLVGKIGPDDVLIRGLTVVAIPEPGVGALLASGGCLMLWMRRRRS